MTHAEKLAAALAQLPPGVRYFASPNWDEINKLLKEGTPYTYKRPAS